MKAWRRVVAVVLGILLLAVSVTAATASVVSDRTLTGCKSNLTGNVRVIDTASGQTCGSTETEITWRLGEISTYVRWNDGAVPPGGYANSMSVEAFCADGYVSVGGGYNASGSVLVSTNAPTPRPHITGPIPPVNSGWLVTAHNNGEFNVPLVMYVVCASGTGTGYINSSPGEGP